MATLNSLINPPAAFSFVEEISLASPGTIDFTASKLLANVKYKIILHSIMPAVNNKVFMYLNNDTTLANYQNTFLYGSGVSAASTSVNEPTVFSNVASGRTLAEIDFGILNGAFIWYGTGRRGLLTAPTLISYAGNHLSGQSSYSALQLALDAGSFQAGTKATLLRLG